MQLIWQMAKRKDPNGLAKLGDLYFDGLFISENIPASLACYYQASLHVSGYARFLISVFLYGGHFTFKRFSKIRKVV